MPARAAPHEKLSITLDITEPGYVYVYLTNQEATPKEVYFDDFTVTQLHSPFVAGGDYYPFGLPMADRQMDAEPYKWGYQGQYAEKDSLMKMNSFDLRLNDPDFARWTTTDPYGQYASGYISMGNNPVNGVDPNGGMTRALAWTLGSAVVGGIAGGLLDKEDPMRGAAIGFGLGLAAGYGLSKINWGSLPAVEGLSFGLKSKKMLQTIVTDAMLQAAKETLRPKGINGSIKEAIDKNAVNTKWQLDPGGKHTGGDLAFTEPDNSSDTSTKIIVWVMPEAWDEIGGEEALADIIGHEWIHIAHYRSGAYAQWRKLYTPNGARYISEMKAHQWSYHFMGHKSSLGRQHLQRANGYRELIPKRTKVKFVETDDYFK